MLRSRNNWGAVVAVQCRHACEISTTPRPRNGRGPASAPGYTDGGSRNTGFDFSSFDISDLFRCAVEQLVLSLSTLRDRVTPDRARLAHGLLAAGFTGSPKLRVCDLGPEGP